MPKMIFINLPVRDLGAATRFYEAIGCKKNVQFSDANAASMEWSDAITFMLLTRDYFASFSPRPVADARQQCGVLIALSRDGREEVDAITEAAAAAGGTADLREKQELGFMYSRTFADPDGHVFEPVWMNPAAMPAAEAATA